jgi:predicted ester cyclase
MAERADSERYLNMADRWCTQWWAGYVTLAHDLFSANVRTNGSWSAWPDLNAGYKSGWRPSHLTTIEVKFSAYDKIITRLVWRGTHTGSYGGVEATGRPVAVRDFAVWRFADGKVTEISTIQDQFALLKQIGYFPEEAYAA